MSSLRSQFAEWGLKFPAFSRYLATYFFFKNYPPPKIPLHKRNEDLDIISERFYKYNLLSSEMVLWADFHALFRDLDQISIDTLKKVYVNQLYCAKHNYIPDDIWLGEDYENKIKVTMSLVEARYRGISLPPYIELKEDIDFYNCGLFFVPAIVLIFKHTMDILDCGAYVGDSTLVFEKFYNPRRIYAFEPMKENYQKLLQTISFMGLKKVIPVQRGITDKKSIAKINLCGVASYLEENPETYHTIETTDIDSFCEENFVEPGIIKMDIEGCELSAIRGALNTIKKYKPILLISIYHTPEDFFEIKPLLERELPDYMFMVRKLVTYHPVFETSLICYPKPGDN